MSAPSRDDDRTATAASSASAFQALHQAACAAAGGLGDFGDKSYHVALEVLLDAYAADPQMTPDGLARCHQSIVGGLVGRLLSEHQWKCRPELLKRRIEAPIVIAGLPRTGTTALHELLAIDPQFQELEFWLGNAPMPRPPRDTWETLPQFRQTAAFVDDFYRRMPHFRAIHNMAPEMPEEDRTLLMQEFAHLWYMESAYVPAYDHWVERHDATIGYRRFADNLRLIGSNDPDKRWVLKDPVHLMFMGTLLEVFPDAVIIQTHRDPVRSIPSLCSLVHQFRGLFENPENDPKLIGKRKVEHWARALEITAGVRAHHPGRFIDVHHADVVKEPLRVVERIYAHCGLRLDAATRQRMTAWIEHNRQGKHGVHEYTPETFGLTHDEIRNAFAGYIDAYGVACF